MRTITRSWLTNKGACRDQVDRFSGLYPKGMPLTAENVWACHKAGLDVIWAACHLMTKAQRQTFILYTLRQRQPHLVSLLARAGLKKQSVQIKSLKFDTVADATAAIPVLNAAWAAAWDAAWDAAYAARDAAWEQQIEWCIAQLIKPHG